MKRGRFGLLDFHKRLNEQFSFSTDSETFHNSAEIISITQPMLHSESTLQNSANNRLDYVSVIVF